MRRLSVCLLLCAALAITAARPSGEANEVVLQAIEEASEAVHMELMKLEQRARSERTCPTGWKKYGSRCFMFVSTTRTWMDAEKYCNHLGGNLASANSSEEYHFLQEVVIEQTQDFTHTWIGGHDGIQNNIWMWSDGSRFDYQNWSTGEPTGNEHCVEMNFGGENRWNDRPCGIRFPSICVIRLC